VILSHGLWRRRFASDATVVGRSLTLNDRPHTVVGVLPPSFDFSSVFSPGVHVDVLLPFPEIAAGDPGFQGNRLHLLGRLRPGVTAEAAQAELDAILAALEQEQPDRWGLGADVTPLQAHIAGPFRPALLLLAAAAATLLLIACVNVSNLILARSPGRARELALRKALGASRGRLVRQLVLETLMISLAGAALGSSLAWGVTRVVSGQEGIRIPLLDGVGVDGPALLFAVAVAVLTGLLAGLVPALQVAEGGEASVLRDSGSGKSAGRRGRRLRETLVVAEVTLACVLLVAAGLLVRSFRAVLAVDLGFEATNAVAWQLNPSLTFGSHRERADFFAALAERVAAVPGVERVGLSDALPLLGSNRSWPLSVVGVPEDDTRNQVFPHVVDAGYLPAMRIPLLEGRNISGDDTEQTQPVVLMNASGARRVFGAERALGRRLRSWGDWEWEVVGIVQDVRHISPEMDSGIEVYFPLAQMPDCCPQHLVVRSQLPTTQVAAAVRIALHDMDPSMPTRELWTLQSTVDRALSARRFTLAVIGAFGAAALLLAGLGIYGVLAHSVAERAPEMGIRLALGASAPALVWSVMARTLVLAGMGTVAGALLSLMSARLLGSLVYGVAATDPATFLAGALILLGVAAVAGVVPATRAARTRGLAALRGD
jgi:predicted permease